MNEDFHISGTAADECELFERIRGGDEQAFTLVYERYHGMLYSLALRMIKQTGAAKTPCSTSSSGFGSCAADCP